MMWKVRRNSKDTMSKLSSVGTSPNPSIKKLPKKSSLKRAGDGLDSDWSSVGSSSTSSQRSETYKCDHSSFQSSSAPSKSSSHSSEPSTVSPISSQSLDARVSAASRAFESSCSAGESVNRSQASANQSTRSASSSQKSKGVKFSVVEIRDYEREIGDNPSCSNGPPIGIGWSHLDSRVVHLNNYEMSRPYRKGQLEMVLTREEREALLGEWGVSSSEMITSTRALNKAKHQRRQTVRNLDKAQRVEEGIESATRTLKRVLSLRRSTRSEVEELQRQAENAAAQSPTRFDTSSSHEDDLDSEQRPEHRTSSASPKTEITEQEGDVFGSFEVKLPTSGSGRAKSSVDNSKARTLPTSAGSTDDMDAISCISGFTLGNSTTASALEIERFHRELEIELFGDQDLPSMVGQTLEVDVEIPEEEKVFHDPAPHCGAPEPPSVAGNSYLQQQQEDRNFRSSMRYAPSYPVQPMGGLHHQLSLGPVPTAYTFHDKNIYGNYQMMCRESQQVTNYNVRLGSSFDPSDLCERPAVGEVGNRPLMTMAPEPPPSPTQHVNLESQQDWRSAHPSVPTQTRLVDNIPYASASSMRRDWNCTTDGPVVTHRPLACHLSPNNWMEGSAMGHHRGASRSAWEAVIISEDNLDEAQMGQQFVEQTPTHTRMPMM